jgi:hypothetical protein
LHPKQKFASSFCFFEFLPRAEELYRAPGAAFLEFIIWATLIRCLTLLWSLTHSHHTATILSQVPLLSGCDHLAFNLFVEDPECIYGLLQDGKSVVTYSGFNKRGDL